MLLNERKLRTGQLVLVSQGGGPRHALLRMERDITWLDVRRGVRAAWLGRPLLPHESADESIDEVVEQVAAWLVREGYAARVPFVEQRVGSVELLREQNDREYE
jgi:hypothetical protein